MADPKAPRQDPKPAAGGVLDTALPRTDNSFAGKEPDERLIGTDIPDDEQDAEEDEERD